MAFNAVDFVNERTGYWTNELRVQFARMFAVGSKIQSVSWDAADCPDGYHDLDVIHDLLSDSVGFKEAVTYDKAGKRSRITVEISADFDPVAAYRAKAEAEAAAKAAQVTSELEAKQMAIASAANRLRVIVDTILEEKNFPAIAALATPEGIKSLTEEVLVEKKLIEATVIETPIEKPPIEDIGKVG